MPALATTPAKQNAVETLFLKSPISPFTPLLLSMPKFTLRVTLPSKLAKLPTLLKEPSTLTQENSKMAKKIITEPLTLTLAAVHELPARVRSRGGLGGRRWSGRVAEAQREGQEYQDQPHRDR